MPASRMSMMKASSVWAMERQGPQSYWLLSRMTYFTVEVVQIDHLAALVRETDVGDDLAEVQVVDPASDPGSLHSQPQA